MRRYSEKLEELNIGIEEIVCSGRTGKGIREAVLWSSLQTVCTSSESQELNAWMKVKGEKNGWDSVRVGPDHPIKRRSCTSLQQ